MSRILRAALSAPGRLADWATDPSVPGWKPALAGLGLIAVILYRSEHTEPERRCPTCNKILKLHVQVCPRCGTDLYLPDVSEVRPGPAHRST